MFRWLYLIVLVTVIVVGHQASEFERWVAGKILGIVR